VTLVVSSGPAPVSVPNVVGDTQAAASAALTGAGLTVGTVTPQASGTVAAGKVISESPAAATSVAKGSAVALVVSSGPPTYTVGGTLIGLAAGASVQVLNGTATLPVTANGHSPWRPVYSAAQPTPSLSECRPRHPPRPATYRMVQEPSPRPT